MMGDFTPVARFQIQERMDVPYFRTDTIWVAAIRPFNQPTA